MQNNVLALCHRRSPEWCAQALETTKRAAIFVAAAAGSCSRLCIIFRRHQRKHEKAGKQPLRPIKTSVRLCPVASLSQTHRQPREAVVCMYAADTQNAASCSRRLRTSWWRSITPKYAGVMMWTSLLGIYANIWTRLCIIDHGRGRLGCLTQSNHVDPSHLISTPILLQTKPHHTQTTYYRTQHYRPPEVNHFIVVLQVASSSIYHSFKDLTGRHASGHGTPEVPRGTFFFSNQYAPPRPQRMRPISALLQHDHSVHRQFLAPLVCVRTW